MLSINMWREEKMTEKHPMGTIFRDSEGNHWLKGDGFCVSLVDFSKTRNFQIDEGDVALMSIVDE